MDKMINIPREEYERLLTAAEYLKHDTKETVAIPCDEYERLQDAAEDLADIQAYDRAMARLAAGEDELIPAEYVNRMLDGESPLCVYRNLRGLTQAALAKKTGVSRVTIAEIETGRKQGSIASLRALATGLDVTLDDLVGV